eukprot:Gb_09731 [translate_table: standard]
MRGRKSVETYTDESEARNLAGTARCLSRALKRVCNDVGVSHGNSLVNCSGQRTKTKDDYNNADEKKFARALRHTLQINYRKFKISSVDESNWEQSFQLTTKWRPREGCRPVLEEAPVFHPSEEEWKDPLSYIAKLHVLAEKYGICRIVPPLSWKPPCPLKDESKWKSAKFSTRVQQVHKLQVRESMNKSREANGGRQKRKGKFFRVRTCQHGQLCDSDGEESSACDKDVEFGFGSGPVFTIEAFQKFANVFKKQYFSALEVNSNFECVEPSVEDIEGEYWRVIEKPNKEIEVLYGADVETGTFGSGFPKSTAGKWMTEADQYAKSGWNLNNIARLPGSVLSFESEDISGICVPWLYFGMCLSSFCWHVEDHHLYSLNYMHWGDPKVWYGIPRSAALDLENAMKKHLPDLFEEQPNLLHKLAYQNWDTFQEIQKSLSIPRYAAHFALSFFVIGEIDGIRVGRMCAKCIHTVLMKQYPCGACIVYIDRVRNELITQLSPSLLQAEGVQIYRSVQQDGEFVLTLPRAYHAGFNCGFNCAEAVNVAPVDWLPHGQNAVEIYREQCRKTSVSHDKLLLGASREAVKALWEHLILKESKLAYSIWQGFCGQDGILTKSLKERVALECSRRAHHPTPSNAKRMHRNFDAKNERECCSCHYDLHFSAVACRYCADRFACLEHASQLCACAWSRKILLYRYDLTELDLLVEALGLNLNAIDRWANLHFGETTSRDELGEAGASQWRNHQPQQPFFIETAPSIEVNKTFKK